MKTFFTGLLLLCASLLQAQRTLHNTHWEGELPSTKKMVLAFHLRHDSTGTLKGEMDSPGQGQFGIGISTIRQSGDSIFMTLNGMKAGLEGKLETDGQRITARWKQGSAVLPVTLTQKQWPVVYDKVKIQTPRPPFPYETADVEYAGGDSAVKLAATVSKPGGNASKKYPAIILITGSGPQDRDETMMGHKPFAVLADYLTRRGYLVLRYDDRGTARSTGSFAKATSANFANDAEASLNYLLQRSDVDVKRVGLLGHSEGGLIAPMVAARRNEVSFIVLMAGPGLPITEVMAGQNQAILEASGYSKESAASYSGMYVQLVTAVSGAATDSMALAGGVAALEQWRQTEKPAVVTSLTGIPETNTPEKFVKPFVAQLRTPWWQYFMQYNPAPALEKLSCKVLAINGGRDIQVLPENLQAIEAALKKSALPAGRSKAGVKKYSIREIPGLNHLMQECYYCVVGEYGALQQSISPKALEIIGNWLKQEVE